MRYDEKFNFLFDSKYFYGYEESRDMITLKFKNGKYRGLIGVPFNEKKNIWFKYFIKGDKESYNKATLHEHLPDWFSEMVEKVDEIVTKRDRLRKLFLQNKKAR